MSTKIERLRVPYTDGSGQSRIATLDIEVPDWTDWTAEQAQSWVDANLTPDIISK